jgi:hypothetical protein
VFIIKSYKIRGLRPFNPSFSVDAVYKPLTNKKTNIQDTPTKKKTNIQELPSRTKKQV